MGLSDLTPDTRAAVEMLLAEAARLGIEVQIQATLRSCEEQNAIWAKGRTTPGPTVTAVRGCRSWHVLGRAVDLYLDRSWTDLEPYRRLGAYWKSIGGRWGGDFPFADLGHFEWRPHLTIEAVCIDPERCIIDHEANARTSYPQRSGGLSPVATAATLGAAVGVAYLLWRRA